MAIPSKLASILDEIRCIDDRELRSDLLIEFGERFKDVPADIATRPFAKDHLVPGCESEAYIWCIKNPDDSLKFHFAVENPQGISAKALAVILDEGLSNLSASEIQQVPEEIVYDIFGRGISMGKGHGLMSMVRTVKAFANTLSCAEYTP